MQEIPIRHGIRIVRVHEHDLSSSVITPNPLLVSVVPHDLRPTKWTFADRPASPRLLDFFTLSITYAVVKRIFLPVLAFTYTHTQRHTHKHAHADTCTHTHTHRDRLSLHTGIFF